jgi:membrane-bound lytic murein transglycosylase D
VEPVPVLAPPPVAGTGDRVLSPGELERAVPTEVPDGGEDVEILTGKLFDNTTGEGGNIPEGLTAPVDRWLRYFQNAGRKKFELYLSRSGRYSALMRDILNRYGLPGDLIYLALIESGFSPKAYSVAHAAGPWQFIAQTGKRYGLKIDWWADERRDFEKSTHAAASYLKDLYGMFDSWPLAAAAYNAGEGKISRGVRRFNTEDFADLASRRYLARETKDYVPKMLAALTIAREPDKYGFGEVEYQEPLEFDRVTVPGSTDLDALGEIVGLPVDTIRELNPELRRFCTPPNREKYELRLPKSYGSLLEERMEEVRNDAKVTFLLHRVKKGETVAGLAESYRASPDKIRQLNALRGDGVGRASRLVIPVVGLTPDESVPGREIAPSELAVAQVRAEEGRRTARGKRGGVVTVRKGDTLQKVARRAGVSVAALRKANGLSSKSRVRAGQRLRLPGRGGRDPLLEDGSLPLLLANPPPGEGGGAEEVAAASGEDDGSVPVRKKGKSVRGGKKVVKKAPKGKGTSKASKKGAKAGKGKGKAAKGAAKGRARS